MSKKILHLQIPVRENSSRNDELTIGPELLGKFLKLIKDNIGDDWEIITSPCLPGTNPEEEVYNFDMKQITLDELKSMIGIK
jgi:hypothetical protein